MADYYSILKKTISGLPANTAQNRRLVYEKASLAIDRQLRSLNPPPSEEAIARQMATLGQAIEQMEREYRLAEQAAARGAPPQAPSQSPSQTPSQASFRAPQAPSAGAPSAPPSRPPGAPGTNGGPQGPSRQGMQPPRPSARPLPGSAREGEQFAPPRPISGSVPRSERREPELDSPQPAAGPAARPAESPVAGRARQSPPPLAGDAPYRQPASEAPAFDDSLDPLDSFEPDAGRDVPQPHRPVEPRRRGSGRILSFVVTLVVLGLLAAGGYALWQNREPLMAALGLDAPVGEPAAHEEPAVPEAEPSQDTAEAAADDKEDARLNQAGQTVPGPATVPPAREAGAPQQAAEQSGLSPLPGTEDEDGSDASVQVNPVDDGSAGEDEPADTLAGSPTPGVAAPGETNELPAIAQKAYLYEEGAAGAGATRDNAAVVWTLASESPGENRPPEAVIRGKFDVPGRGLVMNVTIKRNVDEALPASHIIELVFETPADFSGGSIDNVARFVMKASEQARGEGLIAVPAKIDTGYFLIALNNLAQAVETNRKLLIDSTWIDIPVGYTSGKRALVTLEKGAIGDKVFRDAYADWDGR